MLIIMEEPYVVALAAPERSSQHLWQCPPAHLDGATYKSNPTRCPSKPRCNVLACRQGWVDYDSA